MIKKLYNLKKLQIDQHIQQKQQFLANISEIDQDIENTKFSISKATVQTLGAIRDLKVLEIHKNTMREHIAKIELGKIRLLQEVDKQNKIIMELNKEMEQFKYIIDQEKKAELKKQIKIEDNVAAEYVQSRWMAS